MHISVARTPVLAPVVLALFLGYSCVGFGAVGDSCGATGRLIVALRLAELLFPEVRYREFSVAFSHGNGTFDSGPTDTSDFRIRFDRPIWRPTINGELQPDIEQPSATLGSGVELPFNLYFDFIDAHGNAKDRELGCHPLRFTATAGYTQMETVWKAVNPHPEWSDQEELKAARELGLRYGPDDKKAILKKLPLKELANLYGYRRLQIKNAEFKMNGGQKCSGCSFANPSWEITLSGSGSTARLLIIVEPFFGRIVSLSQ